MKKSILFSVSAIVCAILLGSCGTTSTMVSAPKFTSVDRLCQLQPGQSYETVVQLLGCDPYNLLSNQADGYAIYLYKYKFTEREIKAADSKVYDQRGGETAGMEIYNPKMQDVVLIFKDRKLESVVTVQGRKESPAIILMHNTLYEITKEKGTYILVPTSMDIPEEKNNTGFLPGLGKKQ